MSARMSDIGGGDIWSFLIIGGGLVRVQWCMGKKRGGGRRERVELPDSLMYEAVLQSARFN